MIKAWIGFSFYNNRIYISLSLCRAKRIILFQFAAYSLSLHSGTIDGCTGNWSKERTRVKLKHYFSFQAQAYRIKPLKPIKKVVDMRIKSDFWPLISKINVQEWSLYTHVFKKKFSPIDRRVISWQWSRCATRYYSPKTLKSF